MLVDTPRINAVTALPDYCLALQFVNGEHRIFDVKPYLEKGVFKRLRQEPGLFALAHIAYGTVVWSDELDFAPETLYLCSVSQVTEPER